MYYISKKLVLTAVSLASSVVARTTAEGYVRKETWLYLQHKDGKWVDKAISFKNWPVPQAGDGKTKIQIQSHSHYGVIKFDEKVYIKNPDAGKTNCGGCAGHHWLYCSDDDWVYYDDNSPGQDTSFQWRLERVTPPSDMEGKVVEYFEPVESPYLRHGDFVRFKNMYFSNDYWSRTGSKDFDCGTAADGVFQVFHADAPPTPVRPLVDVTSAAFNASWEPNYFSGATLTKTFTSSLEKLSGTTATTISSETHTVSASLTIGAEVSASAGVASATASAEASVGYGYENNQQTVAEMQEVLTSSGSRTCEIADCAQSTAWSQEMDVQQMVLWQWVLRNEDYAFDSCHFACLPASGHDGRKLVPRCLHPADCCHGDCQECRSDQPGGRCPPKSTLYRDCSGSWKVKDICVQQHTGCGGSREKEFVWDTYPRANGDECQYGDGELTQESCDYCDYIGRRDCQGVWLDTDAGCCDNSKLQVFEITQAQAAGGAHCSSQDGDVREVMCSPSLSLPCAKNVDCSGVWEDGPGCCGGKQEQTFRIINDAQYDGNACTQPDGATQIVQAVCPPGSCLTGDGANAPLNWSTSSSCSMSVEGPEVLALVALHLAEVGADTPVCLIPLAESAILSESEADLPQADWDNAQNDYSSYNLYAIGQAGTEAPSSSIDYTLEFCSGDCADYRGFQNQTRTGGTCHNWSDAGQKSYKNAGEANYCRNPDNDSMIWCFTSVSTGWEYCDPLTQEVSTNGVDAQTKLAGPFLLVQGNGCTQNSWGNHRFGNKTKEYSAVLRAQGQYCKSFDRNQALERSSFQECLDWAISLGTTYYMYYTRSDYSICRPCTDKSEAAFTDTWYEKLHSTYEIVENTVAGGDAVTNVQSRLNSAEECMAWVQGESYCSGQNYFMYSQAHGTCLCCMSNNEPASTDLNGDV